MFLLPIAGNEKVGVILRGITSVPNFVKKVTWFKSVNSVTETNTGSVVIL
jgi:hypothetical protein